MRLCCPRREHTAISGAACYTGPGLADLDMSLFKKIAITERMNLQFRAEFFNALNHANFGTPERDRILGRHRSAPSAGLITSTATTSRQIQFGLKLMF